MTPFGTPQERKYYVRGPSKNIRVTKATSTACGSHAVSASCSMDNCLFIAMPRLGRCAGEPWRSGKTPWFRAPGGGDNPGKTTHLRPREEYLG